MVSWMQLALQFLCLFFYRIHYTKAGCDDYFKTINEFDPTINLDNFTERFKLVNASSLKEMMICTLEKGKKIQRNERMGHLLHHCIENYKESDFGCGDELPEYVSFLDFMCLFSKAFNKTMNVCSHEIVVKLYCRFAAQQVPCCSSCSSSSSSSSRNSSSGNSSNSSSSSNSSNSSSSSSSRNSSSLLTVTAVSTSVRAPSVTSSSTGPAPTTGSQLPARDAQTVVPGNAVYSILGLSLIVNLIFVAILCRRRSNHGLLHPERVPSTEDIALSPQEPAGKTESSTLFFYKH
uniref:Uncharacterized protein n=1 Tax=Knipowitschia caucasica TaxID=637954 RepID=A0AAV2KI59_KNICA